VPRRPYDDSFRVDAIDRVHTGEAASSVARDLGIPPSTLRGWVRASQPPAPTSGNHGRKRLVRLLAVAGLTVAIAGIAIVLGARWTASAHLDRPPEVTAYPVNAAPYQGAMSSGFRLEINDPDPSIWKKVGLGARRMHIQFSASFIVPHGRFSDPSQAAWTLELPSGAERFRQLTPDYESDGTGVFPGKWKPVPEDGIINIDPSLNDVFAIVDKAPRRVWDVTLILDIELIPSALVLGFDSEEGRARQVWGLAWRPPSTSEVIRSFRQGRMLTDAGEIPTQMKSVNAEPDVVIAVCPECMAVEAFSDAENVAPGNFGVGGPYTQSQRLVYLTPNPPWSWATWAAFALAGVLVAPLVVGAATRLARSALPATPTEKA